MLNKKDKWFSNQKYQEESKVNPKGKNFYESYKDYLADFLEYKYHEWLISSNLIFKLETKYGCPHGGIAGDYLVLFLKEKYIAIHDCDDGLLIKCGTKEELLTTLNLIKCLAPINFNDLIEILDFKQEN